MSHCTWPDNPIFKSFGLKMTHSTSIHIRLLERNHMSKSKFKRNSEMWSCRMFRMKRKWIQVNSLPCLVYLLFLL
jgi:hypothetical protein